MLEQCGGVPDVPLMEEFELCKKLAAHGNIALAPATVLTSARKFRKHGTLKTYWRMTRCIIRYFTGASPQRLAEIYYGKNTDAHDVQDEKIIILNILPISVKISGTMFQMGTLALRSNLFLSPLAGYTNLPFRLVIREVGGVDLCTTDLVNARSLIERNPKALKLIETNDADRPLAVQLFGAVPEEMRDAALQLESLGISAIDINMGCPVRKVVKTGGGSAMMTELDKTHALVRGMVEALKIPVTAKMRLGWDDQNLTAPDLARTLADAGIAAIFVHGRTRAQGFEGTVNLDGIRKVVEAVPGLPVVGNGDVTTAEAAKHMFEATGCAGVSIGRGAFYNPWIFKHTQHYIKTGELLPEPTFDETHPRAAPALQFDGQCFRRRSWQRDVPQSRPVVRQTLRPRQTLQQSRRPNQHSRRF